MLHAPQSGTLHLPHDSKTKATLPSIRWSIPVPLAIFIQRLSSLQSSLDSFIAQYRSSLLTETLLDQEWTRVTKIAIQLLGVDVICHGCGCLISEETDFEALFVSLEMPVGWSTRSELLSFSPNTGGNGATDYGPVEKERDIAWLEGLRQRIGELWRVYETENMKRERHKRRCEVYNCPENFTGEVRRYETSLFNEEDPH